MGGIRTRGGRVILQDKQLPAGEATKKELSTVVFIRSSSDSGADSDGSCCVSPEYGGTGK
ncbi:hypothetical protein COLO4_22222 [Corchorus olitorius]|uniref:Uncharacterized protein n=1 Tax=Corchorus olitorius TaxID=93759 RepID=A0A1R3ING3_9ROSI|nr:hypothetical protein COLO4_22222 [Corchorus olitorius]